MNMSDILEKTKTTVIPHSAKVELDAAEFYQMVTELKVLKEILSLPIRTLELDVCTTNPKSPNVVVRYEEMCHTTEFIDALVEKLCADPYAVKIMYAQRLHYMSKDSSWLSAYGGFDLLEYPEFAAQWSALKEAGYNKETLQSELELLQPVPEVAPEEEEI